MQLEAKKIDDANVLLKATLNKEIIDKKNDYFAKKYVKNVKLDGFRKGKIPITIVKQMFKKELEKDVDSALLKDVLDNGLKELKIDNSDTVGEPNIKIFNKKDEKIETQIEVGLKPVIDLKHNYRDMIPEIKKISVTKKEIQEKIKEIATSQAPFVQIKEDRGIKKGDNVTFDFEGFIDGKPFEGGEAEDFTLIIGSGRFIPGFEDGMIGIKKGEQKDIQVTFPSDYTSKELASKKAVFKIKVHKIEEKDSVKIDDSLAKAILKDKKDATLKDLEDNIKNQIRDEKKSTYYNKEIKPKFLETITKKFDFDLPSNLVEQEVINCVNRKLKELSKEELEKLKGNKEEIEKLKKEHMKEAKQNVKVTFLLDKISKQENIDVRDSEVSSAIYYEAYMSGQNPDVLMTKYKDSGLLPMVKMALIEDKLCVKLFDEKNDRKIASKEDKAGLTIGDKADKE